MTNASEENSAFESTIDAFHMNWNIHPFPVLLIKKDRTILGVNTAGQKLGIPAGMKCFRLAKNEKICPFCQGNTALKENRGIQVGGYNPATKKFTETFWVPLDGIEDVYLHYGNDITQWVRENLLEKPA
ncbi:MAG: hypothetical protein JW943_17325 [Deltaproteobacteria bacterium]|nr:hypothetical protein [Deltaproteobacteria bacterium]